MFQKVIKRQVAAFKGDSCMEKVYKHKVVDSKGDSCLKELEE